MKSKVRKGDQRGLRLIMINYDYNLIKIIISSLKS